MHTVIVLNLTMVFPLMKQPISEHSGPSFLSYPDHCKQGSDSAINFVTAVVSCAVSFLLGALVSAVVYYCTVGKKSNCHKVYSMAISHKEKKQQPAPVYEYVIVPSQTIQLKENVAYGPVLQKLL